MQKLAFVLLNMQKSIRISIMCEHSTYKIHSIFHFPNGNAALSQPTQNILSYVNVITKEFSNTI